MRIKCRLSFTLIKKNKNIRIFFFFPFVTWWWLVWPLIKKRFWRVVRLLPNSRMVQPLLNKLSGDSGNDRLTFSGITSVVQTTLKKSFKDMSGQTFMWMVVQSPSKLPLGIIKSPPCEGVSGPLPQLKWWSSHHQVMERRASPPSLA